MMKSMQVLSFASALTFSQAVLAQSPFFDELDVNQDGFIDRDEAYSLACLAENFDQIDHESDQGLNRSEYSAAVAEYCTEDWPEA